MTDPSETRKPVVVVVNVTAHTGKAAEALGVIQKSQAHCLTLDACTGFEVLQSQQDEHRFVFVERWRSIEHHRALLESLMGDAAFIESLEVFFASGPDIEYFEVR